MGETLEVGRGPGVLAEVGALEAGAQVGPGCPAVSLLLGVGALGELGVGDGPDVLAGPVGSSWSCSGTGPASLSSGCEPISAEGG